MKRSRACDDLVALAAATSNTSTNDMDPWTSFAEGPTTHRLKRPRPAGGSSSTEANDHGLQSLQFVLEMKDVGQTMTLSSTSSSVQDEDSLPLRRNFREKMLLQKKKQRIAEITTSFKACSLHDKDVRTLQHPMPRLTRRQSGEESPETPEPHILRGLCYPRKTRCIDPLDKRQAPSFDMSALIMLSLSPRR